MFTWKEDFKVNIDIIDEQHKKLFSLANDIHELLKNYYGNDSYDEIVALINELKDYTIYHFETEENLLEKYNYKELEVHIIEHTNFIDYLNSLDLYNIDDNQEQALKDLLLFVTKWILKHITKTDFKYSLFLQEALQKDELHF